MPKADTRGSWTIKSPRLDEELKTACRMAADRQGMQVSEWVIETLRAGALGVLRHGDEVSPPASPPVRLDDLVTPLTEAVRALGEVTSGIAAAQRADRERLEALEMRQAAERGEATRLVRIGRWRR